MTGDFSNGFLRKGQGDASVASGHDLSEVMSACACLTTGGVQNRLASFAGVPPRGQQGAASHGSGGNIKDHGLGGHRTHVYSG